MAGALKGLFLGEPGLLGVDSDGIKGSTTW